MFPEKMDFKTTESQDVSPTFHSSASQSGPHSLSIDEERGMSSNLIQSMYEKAMENQPQTGGFETIQGRVVIPREGTWEDEPITHTPETESEVSEKSEEYYETYTQHLSESFIDELEGGKAQYTLEQAEQLSGLPKDKIRRFWLLMGFPTIEDDNEERIFSDGDIKAMKDLGLAIKYDLLDDAGISSLLRADSHMSDRLLQWHMETLVEYAQRAFNYNTASAHRWALDYFHDNKLFISELFEYAWNRQMAALIRHAEAEIEQMDSDESQANRVFRAVGFIDIVSFTNRTEHLNVSQFASLIERFDYVCRAVITSNGGRVVKSMGDAFLFVADDVLTGANVVCKAVEQFRNVPELPAVRASLTWGKILGRFGDVFGPPVNLVARLADIASPGTILTTKSLTQRLSMVAKDQFHMIDVGNTKLQGLGEKRVFELRRKNSDIGLPQM